MNRYLVKIAEKSQHKELGPHQESALKKLEKNHGIVLHHSTGSGKTKTFLTAAAAVHAKDPNSRVLIVAPASLQKNIDKEIAKHKLAVDPKRLDVYSYEKATNIADDLKKNKYALAVADEAHRLRNTSSKRTRSLRDIIAGSDKRILATATGNYNHIADISPLVNMAAGKNLLPEDRKEMENRYLKKVKERRSMIEYLTGADPKEHLELNGEKELGEVFNKHVSYYDAKEDPGAEKKFPKQTEEIVEAPMSPEQVRLYRYVEGDLPWLIKMKVRHNLPLDKREKASLNAFSTGVRQVSNSMRHLSGDPENVPATPKIEMAVKRIREGMDKDKNFRGLVYSNYLGAGLEEYSRHLKEKGINHQLFTGGLSAEEKDKIVKNYNEGKSPILLVSSSGAEGLDLKGTKKVQILEPHFNRSKIQQIIGRGNRYESHEHLPEAERKVHVEHYHATLPKPQFGKAPYSIDKYLSENSDNKDETFAKIRSLMKKTAS